MIVHFGGNSCAIFYTTLSAREYSEMKLKYPPKLIITCSEMGGNKGKQTLADFVYNTNNEQKSSTSFITVKVGSKNHNI